MRIAMYAGALRHWGTLYPNALTDDVPSPAGTEMALLGVSRGLAALGHRVQVFAACEPGVYDGVEYLPVEMALPLLTAVGADVVVSWQDAMLFLYPVKTELRVLMSQSANLNLAQAADKVDRYFGISRYSAQLLLDSDAYARPERMWMTRNGVLLERFLDARKPLTHRPKPHRIVWASSPDRGLHHLLHAFSTVKKEIPDAEVAVCYDFDRTLKSYRENQPGSAFVRYLDEADELRKQEGVSILNHISQPRLARLLQDSGLFCYPCDSLRPTETYCTAVNEAMAAGLPVIISDADCLPENYGKHACVISRPIKDEELAEAIIGTLTQEAAWTHLHTRSLELARHTDYTDVAKDWDVLFRAYLSGQPIQEDFSLSATLARREVVAA